MTCSALIRGGLEITLELSLKRQAGSQSYKNFYLFLWEHSDSWAMEIHRKVIVGNSYVYLQ